MVSRTEGNASDTACVIVWACFGDSAGPVEGRTTQKGLTGNLSRERLEGASAGRHGETTGRRYCDTVMNTAGLYWNTLRPGKVSWLATQKLWTLCMRLITMRYKLKDSEHMCCTLLCRLCWTLTVLFLWMVSSKVCIVNRSCYYWQICHHFSSIWNLN